VNFFEGIVLLVVTVYLFVLWDKIVGKSLSPHYC